MSEIKLEASNSLNLNNVEHIIISIYGIIEVINESHARGINKQMRFLGGWEFDVVTLKLLSSAMTI